MVKELMVRGLNIMVVMAWTMVKLGWVLFRSSPFSWPLKLLELLWVRFVFVFLKHEMENINAGYVIPFEYYKVRPVDKLFDVCLGKIFVYCCCFWLLIHVTYLLSMCLKA